MYFTDWVPPSGMFASAQLRQRPWYFYRLMQNVETHGFSFLGNQFCDIGICKLAYLLHAAQIRN
jgi:hypothetical protein